jgi:hypothetical protein
MPVLECWLTCCRLCVISWTQNVRQDHARQLWMLAGPSHGTVENGDGGAFIGPGGGQSLLTGAAGLADNADGQRALPLGLAFGRLLLAPLDGNADFSEDVGRRLQAAGAYVERKVLQSPNVGGDGDLFAPVCLSRVNLSCRQGRQHYHRREFHKPFASAQGGGKRL